MFRFALYAKTYLNSIPDTVKLPGARAIRVKLSGNFVEYWTWCDSENSLALILHEFLSRGILPLALGLLTGQIIVLEYTSIVDLVSKGILNVASNVSGEVELEVVEVSGKNVDNVVRKLLQELNVEELHFTLSSKRLKLRLRQEVSAETLFDYMLRIVKPAEIPVRLSRIVRQLNSLLKVRSPSLNFS